MPDNTDDNVRYESRNRELQTTIARIEEEKALLEIELKDCKRSLERYQLISDYAHDWEMWYLPDGSIEYVSPSFQNITGFAAQEVFSNAKILSTIIFPEDLDNYSRYIDDSINFVKIRQTLRFRILTRSKQLRWCEINCSAVYDKRGKYLGQRASISDITNLMQALGQIKDLSDGKKYEVMARNRYLKELDSKDRELVSFLMVISQKNETLQYAKRQIDKLLKECTPEQKRTLQSVREYLQGSLQTSQGWENFRSHFETINPGFLERLQARFPALTSRDLRICGYLKLGLSTKEIAVLQSITFESAEISRVRLRKKLGLTRDINLVEFIKSI